MSGVIRTTIRPDPERLQGIGRLAARLVADDAFAGIAWRVMHRGRTLDEGRVGHADHARERPFAPDDLHRLYSMTKPIVSVAALRLVEAGRLHLDEPVRRWLPGFERSRVLGADGSLVDATRPVLVEDLLTHRAGLSYDFLPDCPVAALYREEGLAADGSRPLAALVERLGALPLAVQPGSGFYYSYATDVLAHVLEHVAGRPLRDVLKDLLLVPLGMDETDFGVEPADRSRLVAMHGLRDLDEVLPEVEPVQTLRAMDVETSYPSDAAASFARGGIGLFSTMDDYARFANALLDGRAPSGETLLSAPMLDMLWRNRLSPAQRPIAIGRKASPGYGWGLIGRVMTDVGEALHLTVDGEGGWSGAASTWFWVDRANGVTGVVLAQFLGSTVPLGPRMQAAAYQGFLAEPATTAGGTSVSSEVSPVSNRAD